MCKQIRVKNRASSTPIKSFIIHTKNKTLIFDKVENILVLNETKIIYHPLQLCLVITILIMVYAWADISARGTFRLRSKSRYIGPWH
jgi:hypothetical protein